MTNEFIMELEEDIDGYIEEALQQLEELYSAIGARDLCPMMLYEDLSYEAVADLVMIRRFLEEKNLVNEYNEFQEQMDKNFFTEIEED